MVLKRVGSCVTVNSRRLSFLSVKLLSLAMSWLTKAGVIGPLTFWMERASYAASMACWLKSGVPGTRLFFLLVLPN
jgi:hypothetical protein